MSTGRAGTLDRPAPARLHRRDGVQNLRLDGLQFLRAAAAVMVVLLHAELLVSLQAEARGLAMPRLTALPLGAGVDLFFVISGFVIVYASEPLFGAPGGAATFLRRRLLRIVPLYWFALALRLAVLLAFAAAGHAAAPSLADVATSYLFVPFDTRGFGPDYPFPILDLGWTLNYEMLFYLVFAGAMALAARTTPSMTATARERAALAAVAVLAGGVALAWLWPPALDQLRFWLRPIVLEFAAGVGLALLFRRGVRLGRAGGVLLCGLGLAVWATIDLSGFAGSDAPGNYGWARTLVWGGGAVLVVAGVVLGDLRFDAPPFRAIARIGDASYALYLLHPFVFLAAKAILPRLPLGAGLLWPLALLLVAVSVAATEVFHRRVERPVLRWLQGGPRRPAAPGVRVGAGA
ncbi:acyltransferase [Methylobacterium sp. WL12]|uniref:acyltransferase family protein n=1 Tax=Methylobacterium sp. WL12 TaxID=2603890 RepID=UPI0011CA598E|nr:acyltransferase [Methylobacterium sp. WL12]TXM75396.1 acyltransferase [Methylobacterium sp. WL12]